jgi:DNA-binding MarR family transcriptional regulator
MTVPFAGPADGRCPLEQCLQVSATHARIQRVLDEELGAHHGLSYGNFVLLARLLDAEQHRLRVASLAPAIGLQRSALLRQLLPLEKTGWLQRDAQPDADGRRYVQLRPAGKSRLLEAMQTVRQVGAGLVAPDGP